MFGFYVSKAPLVLDNGLTDKLILLLVFLKDLVTPTDFNHHTAGCAVALHESFVFVHLRRINLLLGVA